MTLASVIGALLGSDSEPTAAPPAPPPAPTPTLTAASRTDRAQAREVRLGEIASQRDAALRVALQAKAAAIDASKAAELELEAQLREHERTLLGGLVTDGEQALAPLVSKWIAAPSRDLARQIGAELIRLRDREETEIGVGGGMSRAPRLLTIALAEAYIALQPTAVGMLAQQDAFGSGLTRSGIVDHEAAVLAAAIATNVITLYAAIERLEEALYARAHLISTGTNYDTARARWVVVKQCDPAALKAYDEAVGAERLARIHAARTPLENMTVQAGGSTIPGEPLPLGPYRSEQAFGPLDPYRHP